MEKKEKKQKNTKMGSDFLGVSLPVEPNYHTQLHWAFCSNTKQSEMAG